MTPRGASKAPLYPELQMDLENLVQTTKKAVTEYVSKALGAALMGMNGSISPPAKKKSGRFTPEAKERIAAAQRARWAKIHAQAAKPKRTKAQEKAMLHHMEKMRAALRKKRRLAK